MPRIPIYTASGQLSGGPVSPDASALAFNPAAGVGALAQGIDAVGDVAGHFADKKTKDIATTWANDAVNKFKQESEVYLQDEANKTNVNIAPDYRKWSDERLKQMAKEAPNKEAAKLFQLHGSNAFTSNFISANAQGSRAMIAVANAASKDSVQAIVANSRLANVRDPVNAAHGLADDYQRHLDWIQSTWGEVAPSLAANLRAEATQNVALGVADTNPKFARQIVESSRDLEESTKQVIYNKIEASESRGLQLDQLAMRQSMDNKLQIGAQNLEPTQMPKTDAFKVFGDKAAIVEAQYALKFQAVNKAAGWYAKVQDKNTDYQQAQLKELQNEPLVGGDAVQLVSQKLHSVSQQQQKDISAWMIQNNPDVREMMEMATAAVDPMEKSSYRDMAMDLMLRYQGPPPLNASPEEAAKYFHIGTGLRSVLPNAEAKRIATEMNAAPPQQKSALIDKFYAEYGRHADNAWKDLEHVPGENISMELQVARLIDSNAVRANVLGALGNQKVIGNLDDKKRSEYAMRMAGDGELNAFMQSKLGDNFQGVPEANGVRNLVMSYAESLAIEGQLSVKEATKTAVRRIIGDNIHLRSINGQAFAIPVRGDVADRLPQDADMISEQLSRTITNFPVDQVDWSVMPIPSNLKDIDKKALVRSQSFLATEPNGQSASLYLRTLTGPPVQLTRKDGTAFIMKFDDLLALYQETERKRVATEKDTILYNRQP